MCSPARLAWHASVRPASAPDFLTMTVSLTKPERAERRAAPKPARIPSGDRLAYPPDEGLR